MSQEGLKVRKVEIDFSDAKLHWNPQWPEYSQLLNGFSSTFPTLEPYFIKAVQRVKKQAPPEMQKQLDLFISQEARHYKQHEKFNKLLYEAGYDLKPVIDQLGVGLDRRLKEKSVKWNLAYTDGFETFGPMLSYFFFEEAPDLMQGWDEPTVYLWMWHLSEEFEHRAVCYNLYKELYGDYSSYLFRVGIMWYAMFHLFGYGLRAYFRIMKKDREAMTVRQRMASRIRFLRAFRRLAWFILYHMVTKCMRRTYDPEVLRPPAHWYDFLEGVSKRYGVVAA